VDDAIKVTPCAFAATPVKFMRVVVAEADTPCAMFIVVAVVVDVSRLTIADTSVDVAAGACKAQITPSVPVESVAERAV
jgi:hypothetical protein